MSLKRVAIERLIEDMDFYPRNEVSSTVISGLMNAIRAGHALPPIVVDAKSMRIVDGWHRYRAYKHLKHDEVMCDLVNYASEAEMFRAAVELNASHGRRLDTYDLRRSVMRMKELGIELVAMAQAIHAPPARIEELLRGTASGGRVPLKAGLHHLDGMNLSREQEIAVGKASGMQALYHCNQLILLLENDLAPKSDSFAAGMDRLVGLWSEVQAGSRVR